MTTIFFLILALTILLHPLYYLFNPVIISNSMTFLFFTNMLFPPLLPHFTKTLPSIIYPYSWQ